MPEETGEWARRIDKLLAGNVSAQIGTALEGLQRQFGALAERVEALGHLSEQLALLTETLGERAPVAPSDEGAFARELSSALASMEERLRVKHDELKTSLHDDVETTFRDLSESRLGDIAGSLLEATERRFDELTARLAALQPPPPSGPDAAELAALFEQERTAAAEKLDQLNRNIGGALGRLRVHVEQIADRTNVLGDLRTEFTAASSSVLERISGLEERIHTLPAAADEARAELARSLESLREHLSSETQSMAEGLRSEPEVMAKRFATLEKQFEARLNKLLEHVSERTGSLEQALAGLPGLETFSAELAKQQEASDRRAENQSQQVASIAARAKAALETLGTQMATITQRVESLAEGRAETLAEAFRAEREAADARFEALHARVAEITEGLRSSIAETSAVEAERIVREVSDRLTKLQEAVGTALSTDELAAALLEERRNADGRAEILGQQVAAAVGGLVSSLDSLRGQVEELAARPAVPPGLHEELVEMTRAASAPAEAHLEQIERAQEELATALSDRLAALEERVSAVPERIGAIDDKVSSLVALDLPATLSDHLTRQSEAIGDEVAAIVERLAQRTAAQADQILERVTALAGAETLQIFERIETLEHALAADRGQGDVAALLEQQRAVAERSLQDQREQLATLSASVGAIYLRVRSLEHTLAEMKTATERSAGTAEAQLETVLGRLADAMAGLGERLGAVEERVRAKASEQSRDREILAVLAEMAESSSKHDRGGFASRLRGLIERPHRAEDADAEATSSPEAAPPEEPGTVRKSRKRNEPEEPAT